MLWAEVARSRPWNKMFFCYDSPNMCRCCEWNCPRWYRNNYSVIHSHTQHYQQMTSSKRFVGDHCNGHKHKQIHLCLLLFQKACWTVLVLPPVCHASDLRNWPSLVNMETRWLSRSATYTISSESMVTLVGSISSPLASQYFPNIFRNFSSAVNTWMWWPSVSATYIFPALSKATSQGLLNCPSLLYHDCQNYWRMSSLHSVSGDGDCLYH